MEFKQLEAFVAVVDYGSFSEAARKLYLTQPTISAHVRSLEEELHTKLIIRTTKKTTITTKGYQLYDSAVRMLEIRNNLLENFTGVQKHMIDLAASTIPSSYLLPEILAAYGKTHPDTYFHSIQTDSAESINRVLTALWTWRWLDRIPAMSCVFLPFCQDELVIATPVTQHYLEMQNHAITFQDFMKDPIIIREKGSGTKKEMDIFLEKSVLHPVTSM
ncbi:MAG: LysR family transcriptional regulator [Blautia obeum]